MGWASCAGSTSMAHFLTPTSPPGCPQTGHRADLLLTDILSEGDGPEPGLPASSTVSFCLLGLFSTHTEVLPRVEMKIVAAAFILGLPSSVARSQPAPPSDPQGRRILEEKVIL